MVQATKAIKMISSHYDKYNDIKIHCSNVTNLSLMLAKEMNLTSEYKDKLIIVALLHDYGKYYISEDILFKPTKLTFKEMEIMKKHTYYGYRYANYKGFNKDIADCILCHHENYNGTGYYGIKGCYIPLCSRIIRIIDVYDALTSNRAYRQALSPLKAIEIMNKEKNNFDKDIYKIFISNIVNRINSSEKFG